MAHNQFLEANDRVQRRREIQRELHEEKYPLFPRIDRKSDKHINEAKLIMKNEEKPKTAKKYKRGKTMEGNSSTSNELTSPKDQQTRHGLHSNASSGTATSTAATSNATRQRESWMLEPIQLKTFALGRANKQPKETNNQIDTYNPKKNTRELNPYWKSTGTGLPINFKKPTDADDDQITARPSSSTIFSATVKMPRGWQKPAPLLCRERPLARDHLSYSAERNDPKMEQSIKTGRINLTDQEMNELGAKIVKAEILGNVQLSSELKRKLENARSYRTAYKERRRDTRHVSEATEVVNYVARESEEHILITITDKQGNSRPLSRARQTTNIVDPYDLYGGRIKGKRKQVDTHEGGERVRFFPDDDKYDIKQMFEQEKYASATDSNLQFANFISKKCSRNEDLDDIFTDTIRQTDPATATNEKELQHAIQNHAKTTKHLDGCDRCIDSSTMNKEFLVFLGEKVFLSLPWYVGIQAGHCLLVPTQHVGCSTQLDEDAWEELNNYRKALTRLFAGQRKDVVFFEIANKMRQRPHMVIHCVPIPERDGEMAPFYFKKAIEESEQEWSINKQLISLRNKDLRSSIPKGLEYFWVNFGMETGFAHVIEDNDRFPPNFALEIIGGILHLDPIKWRKPQKERDSIAKVKAFSDLWKNSTALKHK